MDSDLVLFCIWTLLCISLMGFAIRRTLKNRGMGAPITATIGRLELGKMNRFNTTLVIHTLQSLSPGAPAIGIEVVKTNFASYRLFSIQMTVEHAAVLKELLSTAISRSP